MPSSGLNPGRVWFFYLLLAAVLFAFQEALFRIVFPLPEISNFNRINYSQMFNSASEENSGEGKRRALSNESYIWASDPDGAEFVHHLNLYGFRDRTWPVEADNRAMFVGDSFVEGFMAADEETIPRGFEAAAEAAGEPMGTINLGIGASQPGDYLAVIRDAVPIFRPDTVVLVLYANDFSAGPDVTRNLDSGTTAIRSNVYLPRLYVVVSKLMRGDRVATRWLKKPFMFLPASDSGRNPLHDEKLLKYARGFVAPGILESMQQGRFNPFVVNEYSNYERYLRAPAKIEGVIERLKRYVEAYGSQLLLVYIPYRSQVSDRYLEYTSLFDEDKQPASLMSAPYQGQAELLKHASKRFGVPFLDMTTILRRREANGEPMYWNYDEHMKGTSYLMTGEEIYRFWKSSPANVPGN
ncbi:MAG: hypothetical protein BMS9Abin30_1271 [Gammaproteobacteria bacterium]|nr:MAG: hypothetical protein BMS9Abin30_1271 [Gammaproteobacteria bacterium]